MSCRAGLCLLWLASLFAFAQAQDSPPHPPTTVATDHVQDLTGLSLEELSSVTVFSASRHVEDAQNAPSAVTVITADEISRYGWRTLADALNSVRGFYATNDRNYSYIGIRGFERPADLNDRVLLMIDGHRLNDNIFGEALLGTEFPLDMDLIDRIEIVRGPSASLYGNNAFFVVVNVITRRPVRGVTLETSGEEGSFLSRTGSLTVTYKNQRWSGLASGSIYRNNGESSLYFPAFNNPTNNNGLATNVDGDRYDHAFVDLEHGDLRMQGLLSTRTKLLPTGSFETTFNNPGSRTTDSRGYVDVKYHHALNQSTDLDLRTYYDGYRFLGNYAYGPDPSSNADLEVETGKADWAGLEAVVGHKLGRHHLTAGVQYEYSFRVDQSNYFARSPKLVDDHRNPWLAAGFAEAEFNPYRKLSLRLGGRFDRYNNYEGEFSPRAAAVYKPDAKTSIKYIYGQAFRAPNAYENYYFDNIVNEAPVIRLKPETVYSQEVVVERKIQPWLLATADANYNNLKQLIGNELDASTGLTQFVNDGHYDGRGLEGELEAKNKSGLSFRASYSLNQVRDKVAGATPENSPRHIAKFNTTVPMRKKMFAGMEFLYSSPQSSFQGTHIPPWFLANATLTTRPVWNGWEFSASCYNLLDRSWFVSGGPEHLQATLPQPGRSFRLKASYRLVRPDRSRQ